MSYLCGGDESKKFIKNFYNSLQVICTFDGTALEKALTEILLNSHKWFNSAWIKQKFFRCFGRKVNPKLCGNRAYQEIKCVPHQEIR